MCKVFGREVRASEKRLWLGAAPKTVRIVRRGAGNNATGVFQAAAIMPKYGCSAVSLAVLPSTRYEQ